ncbi:LysR family transcriptional regulator [Noviherbaspirillum sp. L7-7A]|uniref:LysR substrate-binding domain-containing protein n=1 Tax=Noviherbaspirillum sp. L7-7A TaxID=2850560 RepID=UPI001C2C2056|nr:LysR substrate-binding domain-containing protein [Noviherbaspirillum sp. L7-7A]MBV0882110.1 LysR family transcriptional regulator [Noviherbaspirillum sp. L7-7A]
MNSSLLHLPPLDALRGFVATARRMSITEAANDLCLTQSAVSRQIRLLEEYLGTSLLVRQHRSIALTEAGKRLMMLASPWMDQLAEFAESARRNGRSPPVTITASIGVTALWILPKLATFQEANPNIDIRVAANNRILDLRQEGIDLAIRYARDADVPVGAVKLFNERIIPIANAAIAARAFHDPRLLLNEVLLEYDERGSLPWLRWPDWLAHAGISYAEPKSYLQCNHYSELVQLAVNGQGVALGRLALVLPMLLDGRLIAMHSVSPKDSDYAYWLIEASPNTRPEVAVFREWLIAEVKQTTGQLATLVFSEPSGADLNVDRSKDTSALAGGTSNASG